MNDIFNKVEFIGTVEQVKQINETLNRESIEIEKANYLDIQEFIKIPEELNIECKPIGLLIMYLLFGSENGVDIITADEARLRFEMYDRIEQEKGFDLALKYYDNIKKYGHVSKHSWIEKNCRIALNSINSFRIYKEESIKYSTDKDEIPYMIEELSKKFPDVQFNCLWDNITYQLKKSIANGKILKPDGDNDLSFDQPKIIDDIGSYYRVNYQKHEDYELLNTLEIIGSDSQINEVREFIKGNSLEDGKGIPFDFNKILKIPDELVPYSEIDPGGKLVHCLLFGDSSKNSHNSNSDIYMQSKFEGLTTIEKKRAFNLALDYQSLIEKYGSMDSNEWCYENWGTEYYACGEELISDNVITFYTFRFSSEKLIIRLSEIFPQLIFEYHWKYYYDAWPDRFVQAYFTIENGKSEQYYLDYFDERIYKVDYTKIDKKINKYRNLSAK